MIGDIGASLGGGLAGSLSGGLGGGLSSSLSAATNLAATASMDAGGGAGFTASIGAGGGFPSGGAAHPPDIWPTFKFIVSIQGMGSLRFQKVGGDSGGISATMRATPPAAPSHPTTTPTGAPQPASGSTSGTAASGGAVNVPQAGQNGTATQLPSRNWTVDKIKLTRGMAADGTALWSWLLRAAKGDYDPREVTVIVLDEEGKMAMTWNFHRTYPSSWKLPALDATQSVLAVEEVTLTVQGIDVEFG